MGDSSDGVQCRACSEAIGDKDNFLVCGGVCGCSIHLDCTQLSKHAMNAVLEFENITFMCDDCISNSIKTVNNKIDGIYAILDRLERQLGSTNKAVQAIKNERMMGNSLSYEKGEKEKANSFADAVKQKPKKVVLVKPKGADSNDSNKTKNLVKKNIDPKTVRVNAVTNIAKGGIAIECGDDETVEKIKKIAGEKMSEEYTIEDGKQRKYRIKIVGMNEELTDKEIYNFLTTQNEFLAGDESLKVIRIYEVKTKNSYFNAIVEMCSSNFNKCVELKSLRVSWDKCRVFEEIPLIICMKCCGYQHIAKECTNTNIVCRKCGENRKINECLANEPKCVNCLAANDKHKFKFDVKHVANDNKCEVRKQREEAVKRRMQRMQ